MFLYSNWDYIQHKVVYNLFFRVFQVEAVLPVIAVVRKPSGFLCSISTSGILRGQTRRACRYPALRHEKHSEKRHEKHSEKHHEKRSEKLSERRHKIRDLMTQNSRSQLSNLYSGSLRAETLQPGRSVYLRKVVFLALALLISSNTVSAQNVGLNYLVLGSFTQAAVAEIEGKRLAGVSGAEVLLYPVTIDGTTFYRLLTSSYGVDIDDLTISRLESAGIENIWHLTLVEMPRGMRAVFADLHFDDQFLSQFERQSTSEPGRDAHIDTRFDAETDKQFNSPPSLTTYGVQQSMGADEDDYAMPGTPQLIEDANFVVAGSFREQKKAADFAAGLRELSPGQAVSVAPALVKGETFYRILLGPVTQSEEVQILAQLGEPRFHAAGVTSPWMLRRAGIEVQVYSFPGGGQLTDANKAPAQGEARQGEFRERSVIVPGDESDFNLARLTRREQSSGNP